MEHSKMNIEYGGIPKNELLQKLGEAGILLNEFANTIFSNSGFQTSTTKSTIQITNISIEHLGFPQGATNIEIRKRIKELGLATCPLEVAPFLRLELQNQQEANDKSGLKNQSPIDAITVFSEPLIANDDLPKGFYLRKTEGKLWLRGYTCTNDYLWKPSDKMIFKIENNAQLSSS